MGRGDYILWTIQQEFYNVGIEEPRMPTDHRMVLRKLIGEGARRHHWYGKVWATCSIMEAKGGIEQEGGSQSIALKQRVKKPSQTGQTTTAPWISDITWRLADQRAALGRKLTANQGEQRMLMRRFQAALKEDRRCRVRRDGKGINSLVAKYQ